MGKSTTNQQSTGREDSTPGDDPRIDAIVTVGWVSLAMLAISIPLTGVLAPIFSWAAAGLPLLIIIGAGSMVARIWFGDGDANEGESKEDLRERIADLEKRLGDLETIDSLEAHFSERHRREDEASAG